MPGSKLSHLRILRRYMVAAPFSLVQTENGTYQTRLTLRTTWQISGIKMNGFRHISSSWVKAVKDDLIESLQQDDDQRFRASIENGLGNTSVSSVLGNKYCNTTPPKPISSQGAAKPYRGL